MHERLSRMGRARTLASLAGVVIAISSSPVLAASQGSFGATSNGSISISASVPGRVQISGLTDVAFTNQDPSTAASNAQNVCVWSNTSTKGYSITATGSGTASAFTLVNGGLTVPYTVQWANSTGQTSGTALASTTALTGQTSTATSPTCASGAGTTASLIVGISSANLTSMQSNTSYTGTLSLLVQPE